MVGAGRPYGASMLRRAVATVQRPASSTGLRPSRAMDGTWSANSSIETMRPVQSTGCSSIQIAPSAAVGGGDPGGVVGVGEVREIARGGHRPVDPVAVDGDVLPLTCRAARGACCRWSAPRTPPSRRAVPVRWRWPCPSRGWHGHDDRLPREVHGTNLIGWSQHHAGRAKSRASPGSRSLSSSVPSG